MLLLLLLDVSSFFFIKAIDEDLASKIDNIIGKLEEYKTGNVPFTLIVEDISGNSFVENTLSPNIDPCLNKVDFTRNKLQDEKLGLYNIENEDESTADQEGIIGDKYP